jgi:hypothetical protein
MEEERYGKRDLTYSAWHRTNSVARFLPEEDAKSLRMIDLDALLFVEYEDGSNEPVALIETAQDCGQEIKPVTVTLTLAQLCRREIRVFICLYTKSVEPNPLNPSERDIASFRTRCVWPLSERDHGWIVMTPKEWSERLLRLRKTFPRKNDENRVLVTPEERNTLEILVDRLPTEDHSKFWRWLSERYRMPVSVVSEIRRSEFVMVREFLNRKLESYSRIVNNP